MLNASPPRWWLVLAFTWLKRRKVAKVGGVPDGERQVSIDRAGEDRDRQENGAADREVAVRRPALVVHRFGHDSATFAAGITFAWPHCGHLAFLPANSALTLRCLPQPAQSRVNIAAISPSER